jgi:hypothetical protein
MQALGASAYGLSRYWLHYILTPSERPDTPPKPSGVL